MHHGIDLVAQLHWRLVRVSQNAPGAAVRCLWRISESECEYGFTSLEDRTKKLSANTQANQHRINKKTCSFHPDAGLHALQRTFLTEAGRHTQNVKALQNLAGHSQIETTMR
jgi:integrase